jgi:hypothetical protein
MTISELFLGEKIDLEFLEVMACEGDYWENCFNFIQENWDEDVESLSEKQSDWANRILEDCVEKRIEG